MAKLICPVCHVITEFITTDRPWCGPGRPWVDLSDPQNCPKPRGLWLELDDNDSDSFPRKSNLW
jgi:Zn-finger nucleic acid-binding protein